METILLFFANIVVPYLIMSFICMVVLELGAAVFNLRGMLLKRTIRKMVGDSIDVETLYQHPLIKSLSHGTRFPAYIPSRLFAVAFYDALSGPDTESGTPRSGGELDRALQALYRCAGHGGEITAIRQWYIDVMDQASGTYRMMVTGLLACLAIALVGALNLDAIRISTYTLSSAAIEASVETGPDRQVSPGPTSTAPAPRKASEPLPIGWSWTEASRIPGRIDLWLLKFVGLFISIVTIIAGAPFLFDILNRFMVVRSTVKPFEDETPIPLRDHARRVDSRAGERQD